ncbi:unnamed protein product [Brassica oleracea var. botrytis]
MDISMLEKFLLEQIKVGGKPGVLSDSVPLRETKERSLMLAWFLKRMLVSGSGPVGIDM